jgi:hypothetical protein
MDAKGCNNARQIREHRIFLTPPLPSSSSKNPVIRKTESLSFPYQHLVLNFRCPLSPFVAFSVASGSSKARALAASRIIASLK